MFELNFRDEHFLPFEGAGAISRWRIELPQDTNAFDFNTLSDVVLHLKYTAREGGEMLKREARDAMAQVIKDADKTALARLISAKHEFPTEWYPFLNPADPAPGGSIVQTLVLSLTPERFPFQFRGGEIAIHAAHVFPKLKDKHATKYDDANPLEFRHQTQPTPEAEPNQFKIAGSPVKDLPYAKAFEGQAQSPGEWSIMVEVETLPAALCQTVTIGGVETKRLNLEAIKDIWLVCQYGLE